VSNQAFSVERIELTGFTGMTMTFADGTWESTVDTLRFAISRLHLDDAAFDGLALELSDLQLGSNALAGSLIIPPRATLSRGGLSAPLPGLRGSVSLREQQIEGRFSLQDSRSALSGNLLVSHRLEQRRGTATLRDLRIDFGSARLADDFARWRTGFDIVDGAIAGDLSLEWLPAGDAMAVTARLTSVLDSVSGKYQNYAFVDLDTTVAASLDAAGRLEVEPSRITVALIDVGLPLRDFSAVYALDAAAQSVQVEQLSLAALGGVITADPFDYRAGADDNSIRLQARAIPLQAVVTAANIENLDISGSISGAMPLIIGADGIRIDTGKLSSDGKGGVIRYGAGRKTLDGVVPDSQLSIVTRALSNFRYDALVSDVDYGSDGELTLKMRLSGINPDMDASQPIILNLNVVNNVPQTLRSLRSIRSIEDILDRPAVKRPAKGK
jgi:hypothetical protein